MSLKPIFALSRHRLAKTVGKPMRPTRQGHAPDPRYAPHIIAQRRAEAVKRDMIRRVLECDGNPLPTPPPPPAPVLTEDEADAARYNREREAIKAQQQANALAAKAEDDARLARLANSHPATEGLRNATRP